MMVEWSGEDWGCINRHKEKKKICEHISEFHYALTLTHLNS